MSKLTLGIAAFSLVAGMASAGTYSVTVTNNLSEELLAPILITNVSNDGAIFMGNYVAPEAEDQILTGDPAMLVARIGPDAMVGHGNDGPPGILLAPGKSVTFDIETDATAVRILSMVAPTLVPDTYVTNVVDLTGADIIEAHLARYDIGHDEGTRMIFEFGAAMMSSDSMAPESTAQTRASDETMAMGAHPDAAASIVFVRKM